MVNFGSHIRIFDLDPSVNLVSSRTAAIKLLSSNITRAKSAKTIFRWVNDLATAVNSGGTTSVFLIEKIEAAIHRYDNTFSVENQELQMTVCGLLTALHLFDDSLRHNQKNRNLMAACLWSTLSNQNVRSEAKLEVLRAELLSKSREIVLNTAIASRKRGVVTPQLNLDFTQKNYKFLKNVVAVLQTNSILDQEEIKLLRWAISGSSNLFGHQFSNLENSVSKSLALGLEIGQILQGFPADDHKGLLLQQIGDAEVMKLSDVIEAIGNDRVRLAQVHKENPLIAIYPAIFPLISALRPGVYLGSVNETKRPLKEWACRALLESAIANIGINYSNSAV